MLTKMSCLRECPTLGWCCPLNSMVGGCLIRNVTLFVAASLWYVSMNSIGKYRFVGIGIVFIVLVPWGSGILGWNKAVSQRWSGFSYIGVLLIQFYYYYYFIGIGNFLWPWFRFNGLWKFRPKQNLQWAIYNLVFKDIKMISTPKSLNLLLWSVLLNLYVPQIYSLL